MRKPFSPRQKSKRVFGNFFSAIIIAVLIFQFFIPTQASALTNSWPFTTSTDYTFDNSLVEFVSGQTQLKASSDWYDVSWNYRKAITIDHTKVPSDQTNFPVLISLTSDSDLSARAQSDGDDILFTSSNGTSKLSHETETYTSATGALIVWVNVPALSASVDTVLYMYYGNAAATNQQNATAVWDSSYDVVQHINSTYNDSTTNNRDGTATAYPLMHTYSQTNSGPLVPGHQGVTRDGSYYYIFEVGHINKFDLNWNQVAVNSNVLSDIGVSHVGAGDYYNGKIYAPVEDFGGGPNPACSTQRYIGIWNASDMSYVGKFDITAQPNEIAGLTVDPSAGPHGTIYTVSYCDGSKIWKYDLLDGTYLGSISLSRTFTAGTVQAIEVKDGIFYMEEGNARITRVSPTGTVLDAVATADAGATSVEGFDIGDNDIAWVFKDVGSSGEDYRVHFYSPVNVAKIGTSLDFKGFENLTITDTLPTTGTISFWYYPKLFYDYNSLYDNTLSANDWEAWIYGDGRITARVNNSETRVEYDLDNISGPANWYYITLTWQKSGANGTKTLYVNGVNRQSNAITWTAPGAAINFGGSSPNNSLGKGFMDEIRISNAARSADWLLTEYNNQNSPSTFYSLGAQTSPYSTSDPSIQPNTALTFTAASAFAETATKNGGEIKYQLSNDGGTTWYWYSSGWIATVSGYAEANTASTININISSFPAGSGSFLFKAYLHSDGTQLVKLDSVDLTYISDNTPPVLSGGSPSGTLAPGTTSATLEVTSNETATCKYDTLPNIAYASMGNTFSGTGPSYSATVSIPVEDHNYTYYIRCEDSAGNSNSSDYTIDFYLPVRSMSPTGRTYYPQPTPSVTPTPVPPSGSQNPPLLQFPGGISNPSEVFGSDMHIGMQTPDVRRLQKLLAQDPGIYPGGLITGYFGSMTRTAVIRFQQKYGINPNGVVGPATREKLNEIYGSSISSNPPASVPTPADGGMFTRDLSVGFVGEDVRALQKFLNLKNFVVAQSGPGSPGNETNFFGSFTRNAVAAFQNYFGISPAAGYFGSQTRAKVIEMR